VIGLEPSLQLLWRTTFAFYSKHHGSAWKG